MGCALELDGDFDLFDGARRGAFFSRPSGEEGLYAGLGAGAFRFRFCFGSEMAKLPIILPQEQVI